MSTSTQRTRVPGSGRPASGPDGAPRNQMLGLRLADAEREEIDAFLRDEGLPLGAVGARTLLLDLVRTRKRTAA